MPRLQAPASIDPSARGAAYLNAVAIRIQPGWGQFLDDCRLRLPAGHALNRMGLAANAQIVVDRAGRVVDVALASSGNADFDRAVRDAVADAAPFAPPPLELLSDDDRLHLRWLFARDRRQAGPATAAIDTVDQPLRDAIAVRIALGELARAARRIARAPAGPERTAAAREVAVAALHEGLAGSDGGARRAAVDAIRRARVVELAPDVRAVLGVSSELELRLAAAAAVAELHDREAAPVLARTLAADLATEPRLALAEAAALTRIGAGDAVATAIQAVLDDGHGTIAAHAAALEALAAVPELATRLVPRFARGEPRVRAAVCTAASAADVAVAASAVERGLQDADASVRAACIDAEVAQHARHAGDRRLAGAAARVRELARDRDGAVRARAVAAVATLDPAHAIDAGDDPAAGVRAAYAGALEPTATRELRALADDRDADVRAAAWMKLAAAWTARAPTTDAPLAARAAVDPAPQVRLAALAVQSDEVLARLAAGDDSPAVRSEAMVALARRRGRDAAEAELLERLAAAPPGSGERVAAALAWLLAP